MGGPRNRTSGRSLKDLKREINSKNSKLDKDHISRESEGSSAPEPASQEAWTPFAYTMWKLLFTARLCAAFWSGVSDCDETYNYWEPMHHLIYGQGMQTWEYDPRYALRSYMYLWVHALPAWVYAKLLQSNPMLVFYLLRCMLGCVCASCEVYFYKGVLHQFGGNVARICIAVLTLSAGMYVASTAYLPSTTSMYLVMLSFGAWFRAHYKLAIFFTALSSFLSWPFAGILGVGIAIDVVLMRREARLFVVWCCFSAATILPLILICDSHYYGRPVFAALNIVKYNIFTPHGPDLYGTEPASYYLFNGLLNFNVMFLAGLAVLPIHWLQLLILQKNSHASNSHQTIPFLLTQAPLYMWLLIFWSTPHKEERFLFPIYPLLALSAALAIDYIQKLWSHLFTRNKPHNYLEGTSWIAMFSLGLFFLLSLSRVTALYKHYQGSTDVWMRVSYLDDSEQSTNICVGKEWHRYPSSFFLPGTSYKLAFLRSEFRGQLPKYYSKSTDGRLPTQIIHDDFNDQNLEELNRYVSNPGKCHYIVDLDNDDVSEWQPCYHLNNNWTVDVEFEFLDPAKSHPFFRAFYVPGLDRRFCHYNRYMLLRRVTPRRTNPPED